MNTSQDNKLPDTPKPKFADLTILGQIEALLSGINLVQCTATLSPQIDGELGDAANQLRLVSDLLQRENNRASTPTYYVVLKIFRTMDGYIASQSIVGLTQDRDLAKKLAARLDRSLDPHEYEILEGYELTEGPVL